MGDVVYTCGVRIERIKGPLRRASIRLITRTPSSDSISPRAVPISLPSPAGTWRASSAPPKVPVSQPAAAATT